MCKEAGSLWSASFGLSIAIEAGVGNPGLRLACTEETVMMRKMAVLTVLVAILAFAPVAKADGSVGSSTCSTGTTVTLGNDNVASLALSVTLCVSGNTVTLGGVSWTGGASNLAYVGLDEIQWQQNVTITSAIPAGGPPSSKDWVSNTVSPGAGGPSGFGSFLWASSSPGAQTQPGQQWIFSGNQSTNPADYMVHIRFGPTSCSGWVSGASYSGTLDPGTGCGGTSVPEPGTMSLLGLGLLGLAIRRFTR